MRQTCSALILSVAERVLLLPDATFVCRQAILQVMGGGYYFNSNQNRIRLI